MEENTEDKILIHYIKNQGYRQIHIDGIQGGITPRGFFNINFYSERFPIPKGVEHKLLKGGEITEQKLANTADSLDGVIREIEFAGYMSYGTALELREWLNEKIDEYDAFVNEISKNE